MRGGTIESRLIQAVPVALGVLSRRLAFEYRNPEMLRISTPQVANSEPVQLRVAMPCFAPVIERACQHVFETGREAWRVPLGSSSLKTGFYLADVFPLSGRSTASVGLVIQDVSCYTLEMLAATATISVGKLARALTQPNEKRLQHQLESGVEGERELFRKLLRRSDQMSVSVRKALRGTIEPSLSVREAEVLKLIAEGKGSKEIATLLGVSSNTIGTHRNRNMTKLNAHDITALVRYAIRQGLVSA